MKRASESPQSKQSASGAKPVPDRTLADTRDCGPSVDSWPILDADGKPIRSEERRGGAPPGS
jgi:hypothetical protein